MRCMYALYRVPLVILSIEVIVNAGSHCVHGHIGYRSEYEVFYKTQVPKNNCVLHGVTVIDLNPFY